MKLSDLFFLVLGFVVECAESLFYDDLGVPYYWE
jgi:hypothetical protein